jgi:hypothetical protein
MQVLGLTSSRLGTVAQAAAFLLLPAVAWASGRTDPTAGTTNIFAPASTPARSIANLSVFVLVITGVIFVIVFSC